MLIYNKENTKDLLSLNNTNYTFLFIQILKLCANHALTVDMKLTPMANSDRAWCYMAHDFSDEEVKHEKLAVKFNKAEKALEFKNKFEGCINQLKNAPKGRDYINFLINKKKLSLSHNHLMDFFIFFSLLMGVLT